MNIPDEYRGMSYEQASREAERLIKAQGWFTSFDRLSALREIMLQQVTPENYEADYWITATMPISAFQSIKPRPRRSDDWL